MNYVSIDIMESNPGDIIASDVCNKYGATIITEHTVLNTYIINKLSNMGVDSIKVFKFKYECGDGQQSFSCAKEGYARDIVLTKNIISEIITTDKVNLKKLGKLSDSIYSEIEKSSNIMSCINEIRNADEYTYHHSLNVGFYSALMGRWLGFDRNSISEIIKAGFLHDIGKVKVPLEILNKNGKLLPEEYEEVKRHCIYGFDMIKNMANITDNMKDAVLQHHEREDGSGYPFGYTGSQSTLFSKIIAVADVYDAMTSKRVYSDKVTPFKAFEMFTTEGLQLFDTRIVEVFLKRITHYYIGSKVALSTGETGEVVYIPLHQITRPVIKTERGYIDLSQERDCDIISCYF
jgi:putative nucleotidyltransferase with HDIG domain